MQGAPTSQRRMSKSWQDLARIIGDDLVEPAPVAADVAVREMPVADVLGVADRLQLPDHAALEQFLDACEERRVAQYVRDRDVRARRRRAASRSSAVPSSRGQIGFSSSMLTPCSIAASAGCEMQVVGSRDDDGVEAGFAVQQRFPACRSRCSVVDAVLRGRRRPADRRADRRSPPPARGPGACSRYAP